MKTSLAVKSLIGIGIGGGIIGGSAYALMPANTKNPITEKLIKEKYTILTSDSKNQNHWTIIINSYKSAGTNADLKFENFKGDESDAIDKLQKICNDLLKPSKDEDLNDNDYKKAEKWCVAPVSISEILAKRGITVLNMNNEDKDTHKTSWEAKITEHRKTNTAIKKLENLNIGTNGNIEDSHIQSIKGQCKKIGDQKNHQEKYEETLKNFEFWCSKK